ncbi:unnamed protein product, partial [Didymodactylos carnosus]
MTGSTCLDIPTGLLCREFQVQSNESTKGFFDYVNVLFAVVFVAQNGILLGIVTNEFGLFTAYSSLVVGPVPCQYNIDLSTINVYGTRYLGEGLIIGTYILSDYWHTPNINYNERQAFVNATSFFIPVPVRNHSLKYAGGWDSNDYQIDISKQHGISEYQWLIDRCVQLGITRITFGPSNSNVSSRFSTTEGKWYPTIDLIRSTIQYMLDYAAMKNVKLISYVYSPLGYRAEGDENWLFPSDHCGPYCSSLASVQFQEYFLKLLVDFVVATGLAIIHTILPARDLEEFNRFPANFLEFWIKWLKWINDNLEEIRNSIPFTSYATTDCDGWSLMKTNGYDGYLFLFNPNYFQNNLNFKLDGTLNIVGPSEQGYWLLSEIYPENKHSQFIEYNEILELILDGQSATIYQLSFIQFLEKPIVVGTSGDIFLVKQDTLAINGVFVATLMISEQVVDQLNNRRNEYSVNWIDEELNDASWLGPHRLLLFIFIVNPNDQWIINATLNNATVFANKAYNTRNPIDHDRFIGFYLDLTNMKIQAN